MQHSSSKIQKKKKMVKFSDDKQTEEERTDNRDIS